MRIAALSLAMGSCALLYGCAYGCGSSGGAKTGGVNDNGNGDGGDGSSSPDAGNGADSSSGSTDAMLYGTYDGPVVDGVCPALPEAGVWQNVSPPGSNYLMTYSGIDSVALRPDNPAIVYAGADSNGLFKSTDCGANWIPVSTGANAQAMRSGRPWSLKIDPVTPDTMYAIQGYGAAGLWKSTNAGVDWSQIFTPNITSAFGNAEGISLDPADHTHILVQAHQGSDSDAGMCGTGTCLAETTNGGTSWNLWTMPVAWGEDTATAIVTRKTWIHGIYKGLWYTTDEGATWTQAPIANGGVPSLNYYEDSVWQEPDGGPYILPATIQGGNGGVLESNPNGDVTSWSFIPNSPTQNLLLIPTSSNLVLAGDIGSGPSAANYWTASQSDVTKWTSLPGPDTASVAPQTATGSIGGYPICFAYDPVHHVLYAATFDTGLWQTVIP